MSIVIPNPACAEQSTTITDTSSSIIWLEHTGTTEQWKGISWSGTSGTIIAVADVPWISADSGDNWTDQSTTAEWSFGPQALTSVSCSVSGGDATGSVGETAVISASGLAFVYRWNAPGTSDQWDDLQSIAVGNYASASVSDDGTHAVLGEELGGIGDTYSNDDFNGAGTWITPGSGGPAVRVAAVSPGKSGGGYKVYFGSNPVATFIVSGSAFVWNAGIPLIVGSGSPALDWRAMTLSKNGEFALAVATGEKIRTVSNFGTPGVQWGTLANSPALNWVDIAARRDLNTDSFGTIVAIEDLGSIWMSIDNGVTWSAMPGTSGKAWSSITCKSNGSAFAATVSNGNIWTYPYTETTTTTTTTGGPVPPRLWSRAQPACIPTTGPNTVTQQDLDMRRKAEILQYKNNDSNMSKKQLWARTIKGHGPSGNRTWATQSAGGTYTNPNIDNLAQKGPYALLCPGGPNNCAPTTHSDVPGKQMMLCMRPDVPLTNYIVNRTYLAGGTKWPQTAWKPGDKGFPVGKAGRNLVFK